MESPVSEKQLSLSKAQNTFAPGGRGKYSKRSVSTGFEKRHTAADFIPNPERSDLIRERSTSIEIST